MCLNVYSNLECIFEPQSNLLLFNRPLPVIYGKDVVFEPIFFRRCSGLACMLENFHLKVDERYESWPQLLKIPWSRLIQPARRQRIEHVEIASMN